ncbi:terminal uridylyltransferase 4-like isoform X2 [Liolophura sinensis]|uniref:terminal uridylyltransferase 4-like isoform X2 n=1 Tax=Liolophura sinensis TaxID=3198878 RepID=UPI003158F120
MAEHLNAADIEIHLKAMLQLAGGPQGEGDRNGAVAETERKSEFKKQRRPRKKKKSAETEEATEGESKKSLPKTRNQGNSAPSASRLDKGNNQVQQKSSKSKKSELKGQGKVSVDGVEDGSQLSNLHDHEAFLANEQVSPVAMDQNTNQNSLGYDNGRRLRHENRPPKGSRGGGSPDGKVGDRPSLQTDQVLEDLGVSGIFPLKKKSIRFPRANFFCRLCEFHCDRIQDCKEHMKDRRHIRRLEISKGDKQLKDIPTPSSSHLAALTHTVTQLSEKYGLSESEMHQRQVVVAALQENLQLLIPNLTLQLYGSSVTGFALKTSDANVDIILPKGESASQALVIIYKSLKEEGIYNNVTSDFKAKIPSVSFEDPETSTCFQLTVGNSQAHETTELLALYNKIDPRVHHLAVAFRFWAKICKVDQQMMGTMPAYVTTLLTVFYLQQLCPPVLPVLHEYSNPPDSPSADNKGKKTPAERENLYCRNLDFLKVCWKGENTQSVGELWLNMVKFYSLTFSMAHDVVCIRQHKLMAKGEKKWSGKKLAVEDPFSRKRNVTRSVSSNLVFDYIYDCLRQAYKYFGTPRESSSPRDNTKDNKAPSDNMKDEPTGSPHSSSQGKDRSNSCKDQTDFSLCNSTENSPSTNHCVTSTCENERTNDRIVLQNCATNISNRIIDNAKISIQDDVNDLTVEESSVNEEKSVSPSPEVVEESGNDSHLPEDCAKPQVGEDGDSRNAGHLELPLNPGVAVVDRKRAEEMPSKAIEDFAEHIVRSVIRMAVYRVIAAGGMAPASDNSLGLVEMVTESNASEEARVQVVDALSGEKSPAVQSEMNTDNAEEEVQQEEDLQFTFSLETLTDGKGPAVVCSICQLEGHLKQACPEDKLPDLPPLPEMTSKHLKILSNFLEEVPADFAPTPLEVQERNYIVSELQKYVREEYPEAKLSLFGSSCNGFGFRHSDLDICMTFDQPTAEGIDCVSIIETLSKMLKEHRGFYNVLPITTAKVPIVKFRHRQSQLEGDISLYNTLAQYNTDMLQMYSMIDRRVEILGYAMKVFAKVCDIGDASRGSLSSYGYILMVLHYLQQCKPPVIPVLQELHPPDENPEVLVDGWNAWYFNDFKRLPEVWPDYGKNRLSVAELWIGMFRYYTEHFDFKEEVVCIRKHATLTRFEKLWNGRCIAIEDPFDLNHNLGAGLSRKMNMYIQKAFIKGRLLYCTPIHSLPAGYQSLGDYFFAADKLTEEAPPTDKCCRACGKIGHFVKECPIVRNRKQREEDDKRKRRDFDRSLGEERGTTDRGCRICGKLGHFAKECPMVSNRNRKQREEEEKRKRREFERSIGEDRSHMTRRDNRNQEFARRSHEYPASPRAEGRPNWPLLPGGSQLDPYLSPGYPPHNMGQQGQFHVNRTSSSPRQMRTNPQHQREPASPNSRWQNPVIGPSLFYYNQSPGSNHSATSPGQAFGVQQGRGHSTGAQFKPYSNVGVQYQQQHPHQQFTGQGRHQESFLNRQYPPRESERYDPRSGRKFKD